jgi:hypothetical protein
METGRQRDSAMQQDVYIMGKENWIILLRKGFEGKYWNHIIFTLPRRTQTKILQSVVALIMIAACETLIAQWHVIWIYNLLPLIYAHFDKHKLIVTTFTSFSIAVLEIISEYDKIVCIVHDSDH